MWEDSFNGEKTNQDWLVTKTSLERLCVTSTFFQVGSSFSTLIRNEFSIDSKYCGLYEEREQETKLTIYVLEKMFKEM